MKRLTFTPSAEDCWNPYSKSEREEIRGFLKRISLPKAPVEEALVSIEDLTTALLQLSALPSLPKPTGSQKKLRILSQASTPNRVLQSLRTLHPVLWTALKQQLPLRLVEDLDIPVGADAPPPVLRRVGDKNAELSRTTRPPQIQWKPSRRAQAAVQRNWKEIKNAASKAACLYHQRERHRGRRTFVLVRWYALRLAKIYRVLSARNPHAHSGTYAQGDRATAFTTLLYLCLSPLDGRLKANQKQAFQQLGEAAHTLFRSPRKKKKKPDSAP